MTTVTIKYVGHVPLHEEPITGSKRVWHYGQTETVDSTTSTILNTTGLFELNAPVVELAEHAAEHAAMGGFLQPVVAGAGIGAGGFAKHALAAGGAAGAHTATGIKAGDHIDEVLYFIGAGVAVTDIADITSEFSITGNNAVTNASGTDTTGGKLVIRWTKLTV